MTAARPLTALLFVLACGRWDEPAPPSPAEQAVLQARENAVRQNPNDAPARLELAAAYRDAGRLLLAAEQYRAAETLGAKDTALQAGLARIYFDLGYIRSAIERLQSCFQQDRRQPDCLYVSGRLLESDESRAGLTQAQMAWRQFLEHAPNHPLANEVKSRLDQVEARIARLPAPTAAASQPASAPAAAEPSPHPTPPPEGTEVGSLNAFGQAIAQAIEARKRRDPAAAAQHYAAALKLRPEDPIALSGLAQMRMAGGEVPRATELIERAFKVAPKDPEVRWAYGFIMLSQRKNTEQAVAAWKSLLKDEPEYARGLGIPERLKALESFSKRPPAGEGAATP